MSGQSEETKYAYKASLVGGANRFELTADGLAWTIGGKSGFWRYTDITSVRLSYRPVSMQSRRFRADIAADGGERLAILSTTWQTVALMAPQDKAYRAFIIELHRRMAQAGSTAALTASLRPGVYVAALILLALVAVAMTGLLARAVATGEFAGMVFILGFGALFGWQTGGMIRRNKPRVYRFNDVPEDLLP